MGDGEQEAERTSAEVGNTGITPDAEQHRRICFRAVDPAQIHRCDFGMAFRMRCTACDKFSLNRGCEYQKRVLCKSCFYLHIRSCEECSRRWPHASHGSNSVPPRLSTT